MLSWVTNGFIELAFAPAVARAISFLWPSTNSPLKDCAIVDAEFIASWNPCLNQLADGKQQRIINKLPDAKVIIGVKSC